MNRRGVSLIELLVVLAVVAILFGLLLSAVQRVRAAADRIKCGSNLRQITLAAHMYHDTADGFPAGVETRGPSHLSLGWHGRLLPFVEQQAIADESDRAFAQNPDAHTPPHDRVRGRVVPVYGCPSDPRTRVPWSVQAWVVGLHSYHGVVGLNRRSRDGILYIGSRVRMLDIRDGTSSTLLAGERPPNYNLHFGWWYTGLGQDGTGSLDMVMGVREQNVSVYLEDQACGPGPFPFAAGRTDDPCSAFHYWSPHPGGANFAFADGSVRFLAYPADAVLPALASRAGGEVTPAD
jgi:prepilin-type processing-associated H-X9-DG protein/prepilin-type N-terminal cleavage/methylation domain-containing protein